MSMKFEELKKQLLVETGFLSVAIVVLLAVVFGLNMFAEGIAEENAALKREMNALESDIGTTKSKYANIKQNVALYEEIKQKQSKGELAITRQKVMEKFNEFKNENKLNNLRLSMSALTEAEDAKFKRKSSQISYGEVTTDMEAITDQYVYNMLRKMDGQMPGVTRITKLVVQRDRMVTEDVIKTIREKGSASLVKAQMRFVWYGINPVEENDENAAASTP